MTDPQIIGEENLDKEVVFMEVLELMRTESIAKGMPLYVVGIGTNDKIAERVLANSTQGAYMFSEGVYLSAFHAREKADELKDMAKALGLQFGVVYRDETSLKNEDMDTLVAEVRTVTLESIVR